MSLFEEGTIEGTEIADSDLSDRDGEEGGRPQRSRRPPEMEIGIVHPLKLRTL